MRCGQRKSLHGATVSIHNLSISVDFYRTKNLFWVTHDNGVIYDAIWYHLFFIGTWHFLILTMIHLQRTITRNSTVEEPRLLRASHEYSPESERWSLVIFNVESKLCGNGEPSLLQVYLILFGLAETCNDMTRLLPSVSVKTVSLRSLMEGLSVKYKWTFSAW